MSGQAEPTVQDAARDPAVASVVGGGGSTLDARLLDKPQQFSGEEAEWGDWKFKFVNWMSLLNPK